MEQALVFKIKENFASLKLRADRSRSCQLRGLFSPASAQRVEGLYKDAVAKGAKVLVGEPGFDGAVVQPLLLGNVTPEMDILFNETFGPVHSLVTFDKPEEIMPHINDNPEAGLSASIYGANETECWMLSEQIESGAVHINGPTIHDHGAVPHGGVKLSGFGRFNGAEGIRAHTWQKVVTVSPPYALPLEHIL